VVKIERVFLFYGVLLMSTETIASRIGRAWGYQRDGRHDAALIEFTQILKEAPNDVDANYGVGMLYKAMGSLDQAKQSFLQASKLIDKERSAAETADQATKDRFAMLTRMVNQRLGEVGKAGK
jgi:tetratricopeptide (TPR) repeat protein